MPSTDEGMASDGTHATYCLCLSIQDLQSSGLWPLCIASKIIYTKPASGSDSTVTEQCEFRATMVELE